MIHTGHHLTTLNKKGNELAPMVIAHKSAATRYRISSFYVFPQATMSAVIAVGFLPQATYIPQHNANNMCMLRGEMLVNPVAYKAFLGYRHLDTSATSRQDLFNVRPSPTLPSVPSSDPQRCAFEQANMPSVCMCMCCSQTHIVLWVEALLPCVDCWMRSHCRVSTQVDAASRHVAQCRALSQQ